MPNDIVKNIIIIAAVLGGAMVLIALAYGCVRKFSRLTWIGWQIPAVFGLTLLLQFIPAQKNLYVNYAIWAGGFFLIELLVLMVGGIVRHAMYHRLKPAGKGVRALDRILGGVTAVLTLVMLFVVVGGFALATLQPFGIPALKKVYALSVWTRFFQKYAVDIFLCATFLIVARAGYRLGILKFLYYLLVFGLIVLAFALSFLAVIKIGFMSDFCNWMAAGFSHSMHSAVAVTLGYGIGALICFLVMFVFIMLISALVNWLIKKINSVRVIGFIDGFLVCIVFSVVFLAINCALNYVVINADALIAQAAGALSGLPEKVAQVAQGTLNTVASGLLRLQPVILSSPLSTALYLYNPLLALL